MVRNYNRDALCALDTVKETFRLKLSACFRIGPYVR
jgi:hypothetical protein